MIDRIISPSPIADKLVAVVGNGGMVGMLLTNPSFWTVAATVVVALSTVAYHVVKTVREWRRMEHDEELREEWKHRRWLRCPECDEHNPPDSLRCENCGYAFEQGNEDEDDDARS
jgi:hypothetical protein